eukprot:7186149-Lingulodinium_polyedra.AAC.1
MMVMTVDTVLLLEMRVMMIVMGDESDNVCADVQWWYGSATQIQTHVLFTLIKTDCDCVHGYLLSEDGYEHVDEYDDEIGDGEQ